MVVGISGKIGSGKDTVGRMIVELTEQEKKFKIVKFADALKDIVCIILNCSRADLEDDDFKNKELGEEWIRYGCADGFFINNGGRIMNNVSCSKERYEEERRINWQTAYKYPLSPRWIMQMLGTECGRNIINYNIWVNILMAKYKASFENNPFYKDKDIYSVTEQDELENPPIFPNWVITDVRFPNEVNAIKERGGKIIRLTRNIHNDDHLSETALDDYKFDYTIDNKDQSLNETREEVINILKQERIL